MDRCPHEYNLCLDPCVGKSPGDICNHAGTGDGTCIVFNTVSLPTDLRCVGKMNVQTSLSFD